MRFSVLLETFCQTHTFLKPVKARVLSIEGQVLIPEYFILWGAFFFVKVLCRNAVLRSFLTRLVVLGNINSASLIFNLVIEAYVLPIYKIVKPARFNSSLGFFVIIITVGLRKSATFTVEALVEGPTLRGLMLLFRRVLASPSLLGGFLKIS